ncbi:MAG: hypothetical protein M0006_03340 [Magnetospirillum sp.]|nr:hypothetical protein [Magnetospirillum sp.]
MTTVMIADSDVSVIHHLDKVYKRVYKRNKKGAFEIEDAHVEAMRPHGLRLESEAADAATVEDLQKQLAVANAAKADLEKQIAETQAKK